jgi:hypothetical protein
MSPVSVSSGALVAPTLFLLPEFSDAVGKSEAELAPQKGGQLLQPSFRYLRL